MEKTEIKTRVQNPVLPGFCPDPCMIQVDGIYYIAVSTFEWYPGVRIFSSEDMVNWKLAAMPLASRKLLDMRGIGASEGIWAPDLSFREGLFYLVYTVVTNQGRIKDMANYLVTAPCAKGPWSEPIYLNSSGFDPSLFHDGDGRKWLVNMQWDYRKGCGPECFTGILLQEFCEKEARLIGRPINIFKGTSLGYTEGPHLYRIGEYYYLLCAEGGTSYDHAVTVARSKSITGPYEIHPHNPILTSGEGDRLQKAGHGSLCVTQDGRWYLAHLCARPLPGTRSCVLGRETAIQEVLWNHGWLELKGGGNTPKDWYEVPGIVEVKEECRHWGVSREYVFEDNDFWDDFQTLRTGINEQDYSLTARPGWLRLRGRNSISSRFEQTLLARRQCDMKFTAYTEMEYEPEDFQHSAGLILRYNEDNQYYLYVTYEEKFGGSALCAASIYDGEYHLMEMHKAEGNRFVLGVAVEEREAQFFYVEKGERLPIGERFDVTNLSDDFTYGFTGTFVGICAQDLQGHKKWADFRRFVYEV
ncbi:MAG: glycoside hydrolase family 43 protein [Eubacteriales bacterium]|nr:glycoside hydrolase family 43 protein [Eubacteriales bacterium]